MLGSTGARPIGADIARTAGTGMRRRRAWPARQEEPSAADRYQRPRLFPQSRRLPMGVPGAYPGAGIHPHGRGTALHRRVHGQLVFEHLPRHSRAHLRPPVRTGLPARPGRGGRATGRDLPAEARRRRQQGRHHPLPAGDPEREERQARGTRRRRPGLADRRPRPLAARLSLRRVRRGRQGRRHDAHPNPAFPTARTGHRRGGRSDPRHGRRDPFRRAGAQPEGFARRGLGCGLRRLRRPARARSRYPRPPGSGGEHPYRHRLAVERLVRPRRPDRPTRHRARRRQHCDGLLPLLAPARRGRGHRRRAQRLRRDESVALGERGRDARGHPDPQLAGAKGVRPR